MPDEPGNIGVTPDQVALFLRLFRGRKDIVAKRWVSKNSGKTGYQPICFNEWKDDLCKKPCRTCPNAKYRPLDDTLICQHLAGLAILGAYYLLEDNTCWCIAGDFDNHDGNRDPMRDVQAFAEACAVNGIACHVFASKSGKGYHVYLFFTTPIEAWKVRAVYHALLIEAGVLDEDHELDNSFDRLFPNQDRLSGKGFGNLIAYPLIGIHNYFGYKNYSGKSLILDPETGFGKPFADPWAALADADAHGRTTREQIEELVQRWNLQPVKRPGARKVSSKCASPRNAADRYPHVKEALSGETIPSGRRDETLFNVARYYRDRGYEKRDAERLVGGLVMQCEQPPGEEFTEADAQAKVESAWAGHESGLDPDFDYGLFEKCLNSNQDGDAELHRMLFKDQFCYDHALELWFKWTGHAWAEDAVDESLGSVSAVVGYYQAGFEKVTAWMFDAAKTGNNEKRDQLQKLCERTLKRIGQLQAVDRKKNVLTLSRSGSGSLGITGKEWDAQPMLLGCVNGVIDLTTGEFRPGRPGDYIKTICPTEWTGLDTPCPTWEAFLSTALENRDKATGEDHTQDIQAYLQRLLGYGITGTTAHHITPILTGIGRNGKGTLLETIAAVLGDGLAGPIEAEMLLENNSAKRSGGPTSDIINLRGKRIVWASESGEGRRLNLEKFKWLNGGDTLTGRPPHGRKQISFRPSHLGIFLTNHKPRVPATEYAVWARIHLVKFQHSFVDHPAAHFERQADKSLASKLLKEASGILAWLVRGCLEWQRVDGLNPPAVITRWVEEYKQENTTSIDDFIQECCEFLPRVETVSGELYEAYKFFCAENGFQATTPHEFGKTLKNRYQLDWYKRGTYRYIGIKLNNYMISQ